MTPFVFNMTAQIFCRPGASADLPALVGPRLGDSILFITDKGIRSLQLEQPCLHALQRSGVSVTVFDTVEADPSLDTVVRATETALEVGCTGVVALGGGSSMDVAKLAALLAGSRENIDNAWGVGNARGPRLPLVLIPTTAGTGSEVTPVSIITVGDEEKRGVSSPLLLPDVAILDATLTLSLPSSVTAATGIDAMVHAIEAYTSANANNNPVSRMLAVEALRRLGSHIETVVFDPDNVEARSSMLLGSSLAGMAFANSPVAAVHALAYPLGGTFHIPHGLSNALVLPEVLRFNAADTANGSYLRYAELAPHVFADLTADTEPRDLCAAFIHRLSDLSAKLGLPARLRDVQIPKNALGKMAADAMKQTRLLVNNPRELNEADAFAIYQAAW